MVSFDLSCLVTFPFASSSFLSPPTDLSLFSSKRFSLLCVVITRTSCWWTPWSKHEGSSTCPSSTSPSSESNKGHNTHTHTPSSSHHTSPGVQSVLVCDGVCVSSLSPCCLSVVWHVYLLHVSYLYLSSSDCLVCVLGGFLSFFLCSSG